MISPSASTTDGEDVSVGDAVGQAMRTARVAADVPADGADLLARWVGCEVVAERREVLREIKVDDPRLDPGNS